MPQTRASHLSPTTRLAVAGATSCVLRQVLSGVFQSDAPVQDSVPCEPAAEESQARGNECAAFRPAPVRLASAPHRGYAPARTCGAHAGSRTEFRPAFRTQAPPARRAD